MEKPSYTSSNTLSEEFGNMCRVIMPQEEERIIEISTLLEQRLQQVGRGNRSKITEGPIHKNEGKKKRKYKRIWFGAVVHCLNHYYVFRQKGKKLPPSLRIPLPALAPHCLRGYNRTVETLSTSDHSTSKAQKPPTSPKIDLK